MCKGGCSGNGFCNNGHCICKPGFKGKNCENASLDKMAIQCIEVCEE